MMLCSEPGVSSFWVTDGQGDHARDARDRSGSRGDEDAAARAQGGAALEVTLWVAWLADRIRSQEHLREVFLLENSPS